MYKFLKNHIWVIFTLFMLLGGVCQFQQSKLIPSKKLYKVDNLTTGTSQTFDFLQYDVEYTLYSIISTILIGAGIAVLILIAIDKKIDESENKKNRQIAETERHEFEERILKLQNQIQNDVFEGTLKRIVPVEIFNLLKAQVFLSDYIRRNAKWIYEISENSDGYIIVKQTIMYELHNITGKTVSNNFPVNFRSTKKQEIVLESIEVNKESISITDNLVKGDACKSYNYDVSLSAGEKKNISITIQNTYSDDTVRDLQTTNYPIVNLEIQVINKSPFYVRIEGSFGEKLVPKTGTEKSMIIYEPITAVLPGQGVLYCVEKNLDLESNEQKENTPCT